MLYDGDCALCTRFAAWVKRRDPEGVFIVVPFQTAPEPPMTVKLREQCRRALHVIDSRGRVYKGGRAFLVIRERLGWGILARLLSAPPFVWLVHLAYWTVSSNRGLFGRFLYVR